MAAKTSVKVFRAYHLSGLRESMAAKVKTAAKVLRATGPWPCLPEGSDRVGGIIFPIPNMLILCRK